jgi:hypothetical protein
LQTQGIEYNRDRVQELSRALARHYKGQQAALTRGEGEMLRDKRVLTSLVLLGSM